MPIEDILLSQWLAQSVKHYSKKKGKKKVAKKKAKAKKNPGESFIPIRISGNKLQMRIPSRNPGTLKQAKAIIKKFKAKIKK